MAVTLPKSKTVPARTGLVPLTDFSTLYKSTPATRVKVIRQGGAPLKSRTWCA
jgi:hypothetical protein